MTAPTITDYLNYANLQMAAEAFLYDETARTVKTGQQLIEGPKGSESFGFPSALPKTSVRVWAYRAMPPSEEGRRVTSAISYRYKLNNEDLDSESGGSNDAKRKSK